MPYLPEKQANRNKLCNQCGNNMDNSKRSRKVRYWINYRLPGGKQRREPVGYSIKEAKAADGKRKVQKRENRIFDILPENKISFQELTEWYLNLESVKMIRSLRRVRAALNNFNDVFGNTLTGNIKPKDLENYQVQRERQKASYATIDMEISIAGTVVNKAFDNDKVDGRVLKAFRKVKRKLKPGSNARSRIVDVSEYLKILSSAPQHLKKIIIIAYNTGMRMGEILELRWPYFDRDKGFFRLPSNITKENKPKRIPINHHVKEVIDNIPRFLKHDFIFTYRENPFSEGGIKRSFKTACINANVPYGRKTPDGVTFHDMRRTVKTYMLYAGIDKVHRDVILGHSLKGMDIHYMAPSDESLIDAMDKYTRWLDEKIADANKMLTKTLTKNKNSSQINL
jgi:integrase